MTEKNNFSKKDKRDKRGKRDKKSKRDKKNKKDKRDKKSPKQTILKVKHNAGFFSCCTIRLRQIINFYNKYHIAPIVDSSKQFEAIKSQKGDGDITGIFFKNMDHISITSKPPINFINSPDEDQFADYRLINYLHAKPFIDKYFSVTDQVKDNIKLFAEQYKLDYTNLCGVFYRGNDKSTETNSPKYTDFIDKAGKIRQLHGNVNFLVQSDETDFIEAFRQAYPTSIVIEEICHVRKVCNTVANMIPADEKIPHHIKFLAVTNVLAKCKYLITTSGNCSMWICLYREGAHGLYQYLNPLQYGYDGKKNTSYNPNKTDFWLI